MILSSNPSKRRWRLRTICGSKLPSRSRGVVDPTGPCSVSSVFGVDPLRVLPVPPGGACRLVAEVVGQLDLHRPLHQPLRQLAEQPARPDDLLLVRAPASSSSINLVRQLIARRPDTRAFAGDSRRGARATRLAAPPPAPTGSGEHPRSETSVLSLIVGMKLLSTHAYTVPRSAPRVGGGRLV